jgi:excisionase family DNA binding protein
MQDSKSGHLSVVSPLFERLLTAQEAADLLGIHHQTIRRLARQGRVPAIRLGKYWMFRASELDAWVKSHVHSIQANSRRVN